MSYLQKVEPYILSEDKYLRQFALETINDGYLGTERTFFLALEALDKLPITRMKNTIIPYTHNFPVTEELLKDILVRLEKRDDNLVWYASMLERFDTDIIAKYKDKLAPFVNKNSLEQIISLLSMNSEQLFMEAGKVMNELEAKNYPSSLYSYGKRVFRELIKRGEYDIEDPWEIRNAINNDLEEDGYISINGIYNVFVAGELRVTSLVPLISSLLEQTEEDFLLEELAKALIKIGTEEVVQEVEKYLVDLDTSFTAIEILENIKVPLAEEVLLRHFDSTTDITIKTMIAEALCKQLSTTALPLVEELMKEGYDRGLLNLEESLYACCAINLINHPKLEDWKQSLIQEDKKIEEHSKKLTQSHAKSVKVGRNDPCPCGSGKKFKKCCQ